MKKGVTDSTRAAQIRWREWGEGAFHEARDRGLPVLLAIGATWCHWCHVMDETTYSDPDVAARLNTGFIPVRVDTDRRPEVNRRYNMGGWPSTAFLNSEGEVLTGFTYMPANEFKRVLDRVSKVYKETRGLDAWNAGYLEAPPVEGVLDSEIVKRFMAVVEGSFDSRYGGFGTQPKFPYAEALDFALEMYARTGRASLLEVVTRTLDGMARGGMYDRVMGGFFRYSTTRDWSVPHFEKMLEDNAWLLLTYASAYKVTGRDYYRGICVEIVDYLDSTLWRERGGYYGSQDADEAYYGLSLEERRKRIPPRIDRAIYVNWNARMASSLIRASRYLGDPTLMERAETILDALLDEAYTKGEGMCHFVDDDGPHGGGLFEDQIEMCGALLEDPSGDGRSVVARDILAYCLKNYWDERGGGFFDIPTASRGVLRNPVKSLEQNSRAAEVLRRAHGMADWMRGPRDLDSTRVEGYADAALRCLRAFAGSYEKHGLSAAPYAAAALHYLYPVRVEVTGDREDAGTRDALLALASGFFPGVDVLYTGARPDGARGPMVRVCAGTTCLPTACTINDAVRVVGEALRLSE